MSNDLQKLNLQFKNGAQITCFKEDGFSSVLELEKLLYEANSQFNPLRQLNSFYRLNRNKDKVK